MTSKNWWESKLIWLGVIQVAGGIVELLFNVPPGASAATIVVGVLTIILRVITNQPISGAPGGTP